MKPTRKTRSDARGAASASRPAKGAPRASVERSEASLERLRADWLDVARRRTELCGRPLAEVMPVQHELEALTIKLEERRRRLGRRVL